MKNLKIYTKKQTVRNVIGQMYHQHENIYNSIITFRHALARATYVGQNIIITIIILIFVNKNLPGEAPFIDQPEDEYPVVITQASNRTVLIVQAAAFTK